ncbi:hypothetical protein V8G54_005772 [Vigna mungo]|uniref:Uncharacterized protein n=1 Tax=Vigna mungo TaxID=3915 RepID=A0AAQ3NYK3_VIGMU
MKTNQIKSQVSIGPHGRSQTQRKVSQQAHGNRTNKSRNGSGHNQVTLGLGKTSLVPNVGLHPAVWARRRGAVGDGACSAGGSDDGGVDGDDVSHGEKSCDGSTKLPCEATFPLFQLEVGAHKALGNGLV